MQRFRLLFVALAAVVTSANVPNTSTPADIPVCARCYDHLELNAAQDSGFLYVRVAGGGCTAADSGGGENMMMSLNDGVRCIDCDSWGLSSQECFEGDNEWWTPGSYPDDGILMPVTELVVAAEGFICADNPCGYEPEFASVVADVQNLVEAHDGEGLSDLLRNANGLFYLDLAGGAIQSFGCSNAVVLHLPLPTTLLNELNAFGDFPKLAPASESLER